MQLARVIGNVVCTQKDPNLQGLKLLIVQPQNDDITAHGKPIVAIDTVGQSGNGDLVYIAKSRESHWPLNKEMVPSDCGILGIVEKYYMNKED